MNFDRINKIHMIKIKDERKKTDFIEYGKN